MNSSRIGSPRTGGIEVDDAAANAEFAAFVDRILTRVARGCEKIAKVGRRDVLPGVSVMAVGIQALRRADAREQRCGGRHHQPALAGRQGVQGTRARRCDIEMRSQPAIRIDLVRGERQDGSFDLRVREAFERGKEKPRIRRHRLDVAVGRHDQQRQAALRRGGGKKRLCRAGRPDTFRAGRPAEAAASRLEQRAQSEGARCIGGHRSRNLSFSAP